METLSAKLARFRSTHLAHRVRCDVQNWEYLTGGTGTECIFLLHGGMATGEMYFEYFLELENTYRLIAPSIPSGVTTLEESVRGFAAILDAQQISTCHVFGHSQGGFMGMVFADRVPDRVLTLMMSSTAPPSEIHAAKVRQQLKIMPFIPDWLLAPAMRMGLRRAIRLAGSKLTEEERRVLFELVGCEGAAALRRRAISTANLQLDYHQHPVGPNRWPGRVLLFETGGDRIIHSSEAEALRARYPHAQVHKFEEGGHLDIMTRAPEFARLIRGFLAS
jgi:pimeloyl-ACP methyl ester carboxylesterase